MIQKKLCKCGCGNPTNEIKNSGKYFEYLKGHFWLGKNGKPSWNKGLTKYTDERVKRHSDIMKKIIVSTEKKQRISNTKKGTKLSKEVKEKISRTMKLKWSDNNYKKRLIKIINKEENILKIKKARTRQISPMKGRTHTKETKKKIGEKLKGRISPRKGKYHTEISKQKIRDSRKKQILPTKDTSIEIKIQNYLKTLRIDFFTHQYIKDIKHGYQCDIWIPSMELIIECDGNYWYKYPEGKDIDHIRTKELIDKGFKVLRLWENEIRVMSLEQFQGRVSNAFKGTKSVFKFK